MEDCSQPIGRLIITLEEEEKMILNKIKDCLCKQIY